jgi:hypothetical protein
MSNNLGADLVAWLEKGGRDFLEQAQPDKYQALLLHVGATDILEQYSKTSVTDTVVFWSYVQALLDFFFSGTERALMCVELIEAHEKTLEFQDDPGFMSFLDEAKAEVRCQELVSEIKQQIIMRRSLRSIK